MPATVPGSAPRAAVAAVPAPSDPVGTINAFTTLSAVPVARTDGTGTAFHSLFQTEGARGPISPVVGALWGGSEAVAEKPASLRSVLRTAERRGESQGLRDLYQNGRRNVRGLFDGTS